MRKDGSSSRRCMTHSGESQTHLEATLPKTILSTRAIITIGTWNVRTMYEAGKTAQVAAEMRKNNLAILGISETRWTGSGQRWLTTGELLLYSGHEDDYAHHTQGVALMLSKAAQRALTGWEEHGPRIIASSFKTKKERTMLCPHQRQQRGRRGAVLQQTTGHPPEISCKSHQHRYGRLQCKNWK